MVVDTRVHGLVNAFAWARTTGGVKGAKPYAEHGDMRTYPLRGWHVNTSGDAVCHFSFSHFSFSHFSFSHFCDVQNKISLRWRKAMAEDDGNAVAAYNVTLNTLAGQLPNDDRFFSALNIVRSRKPLTHAEAKALYVVRL